MKPSRIILLLAMLISVGSAFLLPKIMKEGYDKVAENEVSLARDVVDKAEDKDSN